MGKTRRLLLRRESRQDNQALFCSCFLTIGRSGASKAKKAALSRVANGGNRKQALYNTSPFTFQKLLGDAPNIYKNEVFNAGKYSSIYDPTAGTGGMLSVAEEYIKRNELSDEHISELVRLYGTFGHNAECTTENNGSEERRISSKIFRNIDFGSLKMTIERPLRFKQRSLVHFAVDTEEVCMTTKLDRGCNNAKGNPPVEGEVRTAYLWEEVLVKKSLMDILGRFLHLQVETKTVPTAKGLKKLQRESMIFPRYHQLDVVRKLADHARQHRSGHNYLIQHSAGSGKGMKKSSIRWWLLPTGWCSTSNQLDKNGAWRIVVSCFQAKRWIRVKR